MTSRPPVIGTGGSPPQSVESITRIAQDYEYDSAVPLKYWLRSAASLIQEVSCNVVIPFNHEYEANSSSLNRHKSTSTKAVTNKHISSFSDMPN